MIPLICYMVPQEHDDRNTSLVRINKFKTSKQVYITNILRGQNEFITYSKDFVPNI